MQRTTSISLPAIPEEQNGSDEANQRDEVFDDYGRLFWLRNERGYIRRTTFDLATGALRQRVDDVETAEL